MTSQSPSSQNQLIFPWQESPRSIEERVQLLLAEMSLNEKVAQLGSKAGKVDILVGRSASDLPCQAPVGLIGPTRVVGHKHG